MQNVEEELNEILDFIDEERRKQNLNLTELSVLATGKNYHSHMGKILSRKRAGVEYRIIAKMINALGYRIVLEKKKPHL